MHLGGDCHTVREAGDQELVRLFERAGPQLLRVCCVETPVACVTLLARVEELHFKSAEWSGATLHRRLLGVELLSLRALCKLTIQSALWHAQIGDMLRELSHTGRLRAVCTWILDCLRRLQIPWDDLLR